MGLSTKSVIFFTSHCTVQGEFDTHEQPVLDTLNSDSAHHLKVADAQITTLNARQSSKGVLETTLPKSAIMIGAVPGAPYKNAMQKSSMLFTRRDWPVYLLAGPYEITAQLSLRGQPDTVAALKSELSDFFPLTDVTIFDVVGCRKWSVEVAFVNKLHLTAFSINSAAQNSITT